MSDGTRENGDRDKAHTDEAALSANSSVSAKV